MSPFDFKRQLVESAGGVARVVKWLQNSTSVFYAADVQDDPAYFYRGDILYVPNAAVQHIEMKVETRTSSETPNLAIERMSDVNRSKMGGPWSTRAEWYAHLYADGLLVMMRRTALLVPRQLAQTNLGAQYREYRLPLS